MKVSTLGLASYVLKGSLRVPGSCAAVGRLIF